MGRSHWLCPDPDNPGWQRMSAAPGTFVETMFGPLGVRVEAPDRVRVRVVPRENHRNILGTVHGGFVLAFVDQVLFVGTAALDIDGAFGGQTIATSTQFFGTLQADRPIDAVVEVLRVTGRMIFLRGLIEQSGQKAVDFSATIRKATPER